MYNNFDYGYDYGYDYGNDLGNIIAPLIGFAVIIWIIAIASIILSIIAMWKMFEKAGEPGWASLVPFYNAYVFFKISWGNGWYFLMSLIPAILYQIVYFAFFASLASRSYYNSYDSAAIASSAIWLGLFLFLLIIGMLVINIITYVKLAKAFGQGGGFACGLIFVNIVFLCIIAFSKNIRYVGIPGKMPPYGAAGGQPGYNNPNYPPNSYQQGYQNPYAQSNANPQWGYQNPYSQPNPYQQGYQNPYAQPNVNPQWGYQSPYSQPNPYQQGYQQPNINPQPSVPTPEVPTPQTASSTSTHCPDCGALLEDGEKICPHCGKAQ